MINDGPYFIRTLDALDLRDTQREDTIRNATDIVSAVMASYGVPPGADMGAAPVPNRPPTGLVYGRIQSGKTRAMIASTALAFDNGFRVSVVMTSNINDLVSQTHIDFSSGLPGIVTFTKDNDLDREVPTTRLHLERGDGRLLLICSKGIASLTNIAAFLRDIAADRFPAIIFDDEGDQASLDTNIRRRSRGVAVAPSPINNIIQTRLRPALPRHVYVSVTGTPQAVLLQSADSNNRPSFNVMLPPGATYVGGDQFFDADEPEDNAALISLVDRNDQQQLLNLARPMPAGLRASILFFLVSAASAILNRGMSERGYSYLCHPSLKNDEQATAEQRINGFLTEVYRATLGAGDTSGILDGLGAAHGDLRATLGANTPAFDDVVRTIREYLPGKRILVINARTKRTGINYGRCLNFLIGGNTLGRGIAIRDLLVTYYVREAKISQIDTMHQHARMYGYRNDTLPYTRLFIPRHLYYRFRDIHRSDMDLRRFVEDHIARLPTMFPVKVAFNLRATRQGVLEVGKIDTLQPGQHIYPNVIVVPQDQRAYTRVLEQLRLHLGVVNGTPEQIEAAAATSDVVINPGTAATLVAPIRTNSRNTWRDGTIADVMKKVAGEFGNQIALRFRRADRTVRQDGFISTGTLSGDELRAARNAAIPTLWIMSATTTATSAAGGGHRFMYPTFVIPNGFPNLFIFNRGS
jgi:Z1 domain-containing protein